MMEREVFIISDNITSPLGKSTAENFINVKNGISGIKEHNDSALSNSDFCASLFDYDEKFIETQNSFTKFEKLVIASVEEALHNSGVSLLDPRTLFVLSSTKGNIGLLERDDESRERISLPSSARKIGEYLGYGELPVVVSNACISGVSALIVAKRMIQAGKCDHAVVTGADLISRFIFSGFEAFQALSPEPCRPFDSDRKGITLGEAAATLIISIDKKLSTKGIKISGGAISNDANHISGPSLTGDELKYAISEAISESDITAENIDFISAHGTATMYNDEMESKAFSSAGVSAAPLHSMKGFFGHTLGAAGILETIILAKSMEEGISLPGTGFSNSGVSGKINVCVKPENIKIENALKTSSGFGGCNAALVLSHVNN